MRYVKLAGVTRSSLGGQNCKCVALYRRKCEIPLLISGKFSWTFHNHAQIITIRSFRDVACPTGACKRHVLNQNPVCNSVKHAKVVTIVTKTFFPFIFSGCRRQSHSLTRDTSLDFTDQSFPFSSPCPSFTPIGLRSHLWFARSLDGGKTR
jgi:hypothetical protein